MTIVIRIFSDLHNPYPNILGNTPNNTNPNAPIETSPPPPHAYIIM